MLSLARASAMEHDMDATSLIREFGDVPPVDPDQLHSALMMVYEWAEGGVDDEEEIIDPRVIDDSDLHSLLDRIVRILEVDTDTTVALFKRAIALSTFCEEIDLPERLFEKGLPGRELCIAAAKAPVLNLPGEEEGEISHSFDEKTMLAALLAARN